MGSNYEIFYKTLLLVTKVCSITILLTLFTALTRAQTPAIASVNTSRDEVSSSPPATSRLNLWFAPPGSRTPSNFALIEVDKRLIKEFDRAWRSSGGGRTGRESVVLIFRVCDGTFIGKSQGYTNEYKKFTFNFSPNSLAIVHTHPSGCDPRPSQADRHVADVYRVPILTITVSGMFVYDPATKTTSRVLDGMDWLEPAKSLVPFNRLFLGEDSQIADSDSGHDTIKPLRGIHTKPPLSQLLGPDGANVRVRPVVDEPALAPPSALLQKYT